MRIVITVLLLCLCINFTQAQNVGINTTTPSAVLDVNGTTLLRGVNSNTITTPLKAGVELFAGRGFNGALPAGLFQADMALNFGGAGGGYRHFISSTHQNATNSNGNALNFFINNSATATGSTAPNAGNVLGMSITPLGVGIGTATPQANLDVSGSVLFRGVNSNSFTSPLLAGVEFFNGRESSGVAVAGNTKPDMAFNYGGTGGGYRHFISTTHDNLVNSNGNALNFFINNSAAATGSTAPNAGSVLGMSITPNGVGIGTPVINNNTRLHVAGTALIEGKVVTADTIFTPAIYNEDPIVATLLNSWSNNSFSPINFYKDKESRVHMSGVMEGGVLLPGTFLMILPTGYRPFANEYFSVHNDNASAQIKISPLGVVSLFRPASSNAGLSLSGVSFRAVQ